jgi:hypothetical protein
MLLDTTLIFAFPIILVVLALAVDSTILAFFGGTACVFAGIYFLDTVWVAMIFIGLGIYFILIAAFAEWKE